LTNGLELVKLRRSIKTQLIISFFVVMLPVIIFLVVNNWYAKNVVRDKVSETYRNTLDIFVGQTDRHMQEINDYLYKMALLDTDVGLLMSFPYGSDNYVLTKVRIQNKINRDVGFYNMMNTVFLFRENDIILSTSGHYGLTKTMLENNIGDIIKQGRPNIQGRWILWKDELIPGSDVLVQILEVTDGLYVGALIIVDDISKLLSIQLGDGAIGESAIYRHNGVRLTELLSNSDPRLPLKDLVLHDQPYQTVPDKSEGEHYLVMNRSSGMADMTFSIIIPESNILQGLPYFQKATYFMVFGVVFILALYLFFIRHILFEPLQLLIAGMKKLSIGMLDIRLKTKETVEFVFLANTFNHMAEQIKTLRIGMYEEQLRAQKIEMKQLQAQINPHFYMNSLNIIYNFAALKDHDSVKKMALHLADYFRFIMRMNRDLISLGEELKHIENYLEIQKFRFPNKLCCEFDLPERMKQFTLPALTLQPFVENAIIHGFVNRRETFRIKIVGGLMTDHDKQFIFLSVQDNGVGFPQDIVEPLNAHEVLPHADSSRLGILNVIHRLKLRYSGEAEIRFYNETESGGAVVRIRLPLQAAPEAPNEEENHLQAAAAAEKR
jgi:two-component system sensor histidine kinase YesM